ncbi:MAG: hypothetical protein COA50_02895 [Flavobacteriaceae bacterium]|nr:MAG: hypothetical protein COA50_02895 [Flavobacteriaceae bacterium]
MKKHQALILLLFVIPFLISGIIRHDRDKSDYLKLAKKSQFDCVGQIQLNSDLTGSAVLIKENYILTVAHNLIENDVRVDTIDNNGMVFYANVPINHRVAKIENVKFCLNEKEYPISKIIIHPNYLKNFDAGEHDIAIVKLAKPITKIEPANLNNQEDELNSKVVGVGYGGFGIGNSEKLEFNNDKIAGQNVVDSIGGQKIDGLYNLLYCDFDQPDVTESNKMGSPVPLDLEYLCSAGDSGGGLFKKSGQNWTLLGICKGSEFDHRQFEKTKHYGQVMRWTRILPYYEWINKNSL